MRAIWKRELKSYFQTVTGWLFIAATLALFGLYFNVYNMYYGSTDISSTLSAVTFLFLVTVRFLRCVPWQRSGRIRQDRKSVV